jgi:hypothetical protein
VPRIVEQGSPAGMKDGVLWGERPGNDAFMSVPVDVSENRERLG